jgi:hypothetical protein
MSEIDVSALAPVANRAALRPLSNKLTEVIFYSGQASVPSVNRIHLAHFKKLVGEKRT